MEPAFRVTPLPPALSTATPRSRDPAEPGANRSPACPLQSISTAGGPPPARVCAGLASMVTSREMAGSPLASLMVPATAKPMTADLPGETASAALIAARSDPAPESARFATTRGSGARPAGACRPARARPAGAYRLARATAGPGGPAGMAGMASTAGTPAARHREPAIRDMILRPKEPSDNSRIITTMPPLCPHHLIRKTPGLPGVCARGRHSKRRDVLEAHATRCR